jgi:hypothetical protein
MAEEPKKTEVTPAPATPAPETPAAPEKQTVPFGPLPTPQPDIKTMIRKPVRVPSKELEKA